MSTDLEKLRQRVEQSPQNELFRFSLGKALWDAGDVEGATPHFEAALALKTDWMLVAILLGRCWLKRGDLAKARAHFELGLRLAIEQKHDGPREEVEALLASLGSG